MININKVIGNKGILNHSSPGMRPLINYPIPSEYPKTYIYIGAALNSVCYVLTYHTHIDGWTDRHTYTVCLRLKGHEFEGRQEERKRVEIM